MPSSPQSENAIGHNSPVRGPWPYPRVKAQLDDVGVVRVPAVFDERDVSYLRKEVDDVVGALASDEDLVWRSRAKGGGTVVQRVTRANLFSATLQSLCDSPILLELGALSLGVAAQKVRIASGIEGSDGVVLVIKDPRNATLHKQLKWHRDDTFTQHLAINPFVSLGVYLDPADARRGALIVLPKSHILTMPFRFEETCRRVRGQLVVPADPGDVVIHRSDLFHRSAAHEVVGEVRRVLYVNAFVA